MTYRRFHLVVNLPLLLSLAVLAAILLPASTWAGLVPVAGILLAVVMIATTPWDAYAVANRLWDFPDDRLLGRLWGLPYEEYAFFAIQTVEVVLLTMIVLTLFPVPAARVVPPPSMVQWGSAGVIAVLWLVVFFTVRRPEPTTWRWHYAWHLLYWILPVIVLQWVIGGDVLLRRWPALVGPTLVIGGVLTCADLMAVRRGIWFFDERQITGFRFRSVLPWEEAAFFFLTSLLVAQSIIILLPEHLRSVMP